jgi:diguanylate cyclase (GGDEF)-like protein/PAS domain S-box-containing protein
LKPLEKNGLQAATPGIAGEAKALIVAETIPTAGWRVQLTTPEEKVFAPLQQTMNRVYGTAGVLTLLTILALWFAIQNALTPLEKVSALIHQMASGKGGLHRLPLFGDKEIKRLLESFNKLIAQRHHYEQTIRVNEARLTRAELAANMGHWELHLGNKMIFGSQGAIKIYGLDNEALGLEAIQGMTLPEYRPSLDAAMAALLESGAPYDVEYKMRLPHTGEIKAIHSQAFFDKEKQIVFGILQDITKPKRYEEQLRESEAHYRLLAENSQDVIWTLDFATQRFTYVSPSVVKMRGYTAEEVMQQTLAESLTPEALATANDAIANLLAGLKTGDRDNLSATMEIEQPHRDGHLVPTEVVASCVLDELGYPKTIVGITRDITERKKAQAMLEHMAHSDPLTGLPNRRHFISLAKQELARTLRYGGKLSMLMMDIDHFKSINDAYGHATGDWVLRRIGAVCRDVLREIDVTARIGGEEFAIMLPQTDEARAVAAAERLRETIATISGAPQTNHTLTLSVSIGVATLSAATGDLDTLLFLADKALYKAKHAGRNRVWAHDDQTA